MHNDDLTRDQIRTAGELDESLALTPVGGADVDEEAEDAYRRSLQVTVELSGHILRQKYGVVNRIDAETGCSTSSSPIIPRAINLLALRPNGSFLSYLQISLKIRPQERAAVRRYASPERGRPGGRVCD
ncbi:hypothetical protein V1525DRAFT_422466 [Lipomyces kononenkoae]|uniref:Uncharacterized protein n=1 Tax=Lipomyces kononenkoae TaxID=34357 RepID=A0ACC3SS63_LIPKO